MRDGQVFNSLNLLRVAANKKCVMFDLAHAELL